MDIVITICFVRNYYTDTKDYHYDQWYNYSVPLDVVSNDEIKDTFKNLKEQAKKKQNNGNACTSVVNDKYDVMYYKEPEVSEYTLDRNMEYSTVLKENDKVNIYGNNTLLQSNNEDIVTGWNGSVVAKVIDNDIQKLSYSDYGVTADITSGQGYNGEMLDSSGLIYLRARYYDPSVSRFVQIDNNYDGEKQSVASQNKYVYTLNNPYKYVDRNGNWWVFDAIGDAIDNAVKTVKKVVKKAVKTVTSWFNNTVKTVGRVINTAISAGKATVKAIYDGIGGNSSNGNGGGSQKKKPSYKKVNPKAKCPEKDEDDISLIDILTTCIDWGSAIKDLVIAFDSNIKFNGVNIILKHIKSGQFNIGGIKITISGVRNKVAELTGLATGPRTKISTILITSMKHQFINAYKGVGLVSAFISFASDTALALVDLMLGIITLIRFIAIPVGNALYSVLRTVASSLLKTVLMPFLGLFAWNFFQES